ncbi:MAG: hypothetical protein ED559_10845 [Phycisphaera sp.]|nr:MAG: hypothetical protein ED559_10845 [Phycisphaera sp.]
MTTTLTQRSLHTWVWRVLYIVAAFVASRASATSYQSQASEAIESIVEVAPDAGIVIVLDNAAEQRQSEAGQSLTTMLDTLGITGDDGAFSEGWSELAQKIGMREDVAFDKFFGQRVLFVSEGLTIDGDGQWAIATVVDETLAIRMIKRLGGKGRDLIADQPIFAIEGGAYRVSPISVRGVAGRKARLFVIAPRQSAELFADLVKGLSKKERWADLVGQNRVLSPQFAGRLRAEGSDVAQITALMNEEGWNGQAMFETPGFEQITPGWSGKTFDKFTDDAWLVLADEVDAMFLFKGPMAGVIPVKGDLPDRLSEHATDRVLMKIGPVENGTAITAAIELDGSPAAAKVADEAMQGLAVFLTGNPEATPDYDGFLPNAARVAKLDGVLHDDLLKPMLGENPNLSWFVLNERERCWWVLRLGPADGDEARTLERVAQALPARGEGGRLSSMGIARPGLLAGMIDRLLVPDRSIAPPMEQVDTFRWSSKQRPGQTEIGFSLRMNSSQD